MRTSLNRPVANSARRPAAPLSSVKVSPTRKGSEANTVPASARCRPSTRMSLRTKGSTAQADWNREDASKAASRVGLRRTAVMEGMCM